MNIEDILSEIDAEIARLQQAKALLGDVTTNGSTALRRKPGRPAGSHAAAPAAAPKEPKRRMMSAEGRAKIAAAQKARWAKTKKAVKSPVAKRKPGRPAKSVAKKATTSAKKTAATKAESSTPQA